MKKLLVVFGTLILLLLLQPLLGLGNPFESDQLALASESGNSLVSE